MRRSLAVVPLLAVSALTLGACSGGSSVPAFTTGWEWTVNQTLAYETDREFDLATGEIGPAAPGEGLSLPDAESEEGEATVESVEAAKCETFVGDNSAWVVGDVLLYTHFASDLPEASPEFQETSERIGAEVTEEAGSQFDVEMFLDGDRNPEYDRIVAERKALTEQAWAAESQGMRDQYEANEQAMRERWAGIYSEDGVRQAQQVIIEECGIEPPADYVFPTAEDLEIDLTYPRDRP